MQHEYVIAFTPSEHLSLLPRLETPVTLALPERWTDDSSDKFYKRPLLYVVLTGRNSEQQWPLAVLYAMAPRVYSLPIALVLQLKNNAGVDVVKSTDSAMLKWKYGPLGIVR